MTGRGVVVEGADGTPFLPGFTSGAKLTSEIHERCPGGTTPRGGRGESATPDPSSGQQMGPLAAGDGVILQTDVQNVWGHNKDPLSQDFPGGPVVRAQRFHCRGPGLTPGQGTKIPQAAR